MLANIGVGGLVETQGPMSFRVLTAALAIALIPSPALADPVVTTISGDDQRLYIRTATEQVTRLNTDLKTGKVGLFSGQESETYFTKGQIRISSDRFFELLEERQAAVAFRERVYARRADRAFWGYATLGGIALGAGAMVLGYNLSFSRGMGGMSGVATGFGGVALGTGLVSSLVWLWKAGPDYSWEQANDAIVDYNKRLDAR